MASIQHHRHLLGASTDTPPTTGDHPLTTQDPNFNSNMVIVLAALLCALVCALALNSIFRCAMRCGVFRLGHGGGGWGDESAAGEGLNKAALSKIPVEEYRGGAGEGESVAAAAECPICLAEFAEGEKVRVLPKCNHGFHVSCVDKWLASHSSCPTCRQQLVLLQQPNNNSSGGISTLSDWI